MNNDEFSCRNSFICWTNKYLLNKNLNMSLKLKSKLWNPHKYGFVNSWNYITPLEESIGKGVYILRCICGWRCGIQWKLLNINQQRGMKGLGEQLSLKLKVKKQVWCTKRNCILIACHLSSQRNYEYNFFRISKRFVT